MTRVTVPSLKRDEKSEGKLGTIVKMPRNPTNRDIADAITNLHDCVHRVGENLDEFKKDTQRSHDEMKREISKVDSRVSKLEGYQEGIASRLGVPVQIPDNKPVKPKSLIGFMTPMKALWMGAIAVAAGSGAYKLFVAIIVPAAIAFHHAMLAGN